MEDRQKVSQTALTDYAVKRQEALNNKPKAEFIPIEYKGNFQADDTPYDPLDYKEVRQRILNNVETAINNRFPLQSDKYILTIDDVHYQGHDYTKKDEKDALLQGNSLSARLRGTWNLYDKTTGKLIDSKTATLLNVPYMTSKGTFIRNGSEFALKNMFRLRSGIYTRIKNDGNIATHINPEQGTGRQSTINMDSETGIFTIKLGTRNYGVLPLLKAMGANPDDIEKAWGKELFETNYNKYKNIMTGADTKGANEYTTLWKEHYSKMKLDPETTGYTLGVPFKEVNENMFLRSTAKILDIAKTYDASKTDPRDSLLFQKVMGSADYIPEKIVRDGGHLAQNLFNAIHRTGNLSVITPGVYQQHVDSVFLDDKHASYVDGASPFESIDLNASVSRIGEGGIGDLRAAPAESRHVQNSYLGFIDPIRSPESLKVGLDNFLSYGVKKDSNGNLYSMFIKNGEDKPKYIKMTDAAKSIVATPEYYDPSADPEEFIPALNRGKDLEYVKRKEVDYFLASPNRMMSVGASTIPGIGGIRSNRTLMGSKYPLQALPLEKPEAPLVQRALTLDDGTETTTERYVARALGAQFSPVDGKVTAITDDEITIKGIDGQKYTVDLYNDYPSNQKGFIHNTPIVQVGQRVKANDLLAPSNYTTGDGVAALGVNLKTAFLNAPEGASFEDGIYISESAAKKLSSEQLYKTRISDDDDIEYDKNKFLNLFKTKDFTPEQLDILDDKGIVKVGTVLNYGDPMILGVQHRPAGLHGIANKATVPYVEKWEHHYPGTVTAVTDGSKRAAVYVKTYTPMKPGDKMCYDDKTEVCTDKGWKLFKDVEEDDKFLTLDLSSGVTSFSYFSRYYRWEHKGRLYAYESNKVSLRITENHNHVYSMSPAMTFVSTDLIKNLKGKPFYHIIGTDFDNIDSFARADVGHYKEGWVKYDGYVYCVEIPDTHTVYTRRRGKCVWSGNSNRMGAKSTVSAIVPDEDMLKDANGEPFDVIQSSLGIPSRINPIQLAELQLGKIAKHTGVPEVLPDFPKFNIREYTLNKLKEHGLSDTERVYDPVTDMYIDNVGTGYMFQYKLKHMAESKKGSRSTGDYTMEETPLKGGSEGARRFGSMEWGALMGHTGLESEIAKDAKLIRGQMNHEFWQKVRNGETPDKPGIPLVHKKFFAHLQAAGINVEDRGRTVHFFGATDEDIRRLTKNRQVTTASTYDAKDLRPIKGGLFDPNIFGENGDQWGYYDLPEPILNPMMAKSVQAILGWKQSEMQEVLEGAREVNGKVGTEAIMAALDNMDLDKEMRDTKALLKNKSTPVSKRSDLAKKYRALYAIKENDKQPNDFFLTRIPILPPRYRAVSIIGNDVGIVSDANFLYKKFIDAVEDFKEAKQVLPQEELLDARKTLYNSIEAVIGLRDSDDPKLQSKKVEGVLAWVTGKGSPKCYDSETEILTENGWVKFPEYHDNRIKVATMNPATGLFEWQHPTDILHNWYEGPMVHTHTTRIDTCVTGNHDHYVMGRKGRGKNARWGEWHKEEALEIATVTRRNKLRVSTDGFDGMLPNCTQFWPGTMEEFAQFIGWYLADGSVHTDNCNVYIDVKTDSTKDQKLSALLLKQQGCGVRVTRRVHTKHVRTGKVNTPEGYQMTRFSVISKPLALWVRANAGAGSSTKRLSKEVLNWDKPYLIALWQGYHAGDGYKFKSQKQQNGKTWQNRSSLTNNGHEISTVSPFLVDNFEEIGCKIGLQVNCNAKVDYRPDCHPLYTISMHGFNYSLVEYPKQHTVFDYRGMVHCVTVPNGLVITRRNHKVIVSGNCGSTHRKVFGTTVDVGGRNVISPDNSLALDEVGISEETAWNMYEPFVVRKLRQRGMSMTGAVDAVLNRDKEAFMALEDCLKERPLLINRAPTLHKYSIMACKPKITKGNTLHVSPAICKQFNADFDGNCVDFDVEIFLKSTLDNPYFRAILMLVADEDNLCNINNSKEKGLFMLTKDDIVVIGDVEKNEVTYIGPIGKLPRQGEPVKDRNGADVYAIPEGVATLSYDVTTGLPCWKAIKHLTVEQDKQVVKVTANTHEIIVSDNESLAVFDEETGNLKKVAPADAKGKLIPSLRCDPKTCGDYGNTELGWLHGMFISDGWTDICHNVTGIAKMEDIKRDKFVRICQEQLDANLHIKEYRYENVKSSDKKLGDSCKYHIQSELTSAHFTDLKFYDYDKELNIVTTYDKSALHKTIPFKCLHTGSEEYLWGLLSGLLDGDGSITCNTTYANPRYGAHVSTSSPSLRDALKMLGYKLGIRVSVTVIPPRGLSNEAYTVTFSTVDLQKNLDKLTCVGAHETSVLAGWKQAPINMDRNDFVPVTHNEKKVLCSAFLAIGDKATYTSLRKGYACRETFLKALKSLPEDVQNMPEFISAYKRARNPYTLWVQVKDVEQLDKREVFDLEVEDTKVFVVNQGLVVWDTMNFHVPVSQQAVKESYEKMSPAHNLLSPANMRAHYKPVGEFAQGLYFGSKINSKKKPIRFNTLAEAQDALKKGLIKWDDPIDIPDAEAKKVLDKED